MVFVNFTKKKRNESSNCSTSLKRWKNDKVIVLIKKKLAVIIQKPNLL